MSRTIELGIDVPVIVTNNSIIDSISVNGVEQEIINKNVDITVPVNVSELINDTGFITEDDLPSNLATTTDVSNAVSSHNVSNTAHSDLRTSITDINNLIPSQASSENKLADKSFVNSSINSAAAFFRGNFATHADLIAYTGPVTNNDYAYVEADETHDNEAWRYIYVLGTGWQAQFRVNETPFTAAQLAAINSGITDTQVAAIGSNTAAIVALDGSVGNKVNKTGDTMTGDLNITNGVLSVENNYMYFNKTNDTYGWEFGSKTDGSFYFNRIATQGKVQAAIIGGNFNFIVKGDAYVGGTSSGNAKKLATEEFVIKPIINTSSALTTGYNKLTISSDTSISLPASYTTEEFKGVIIYTAGTVTFPSAVSLYGDTIDEAGTYEFSIQDNRGIIIKLQ